MSTGRMEQQGVTVNVENIGGIRETEVTFTPGVTLLVGRNATNRTSFLQAVMAALGSDAASIRGGADEGRVELTIGDESYSRRLVRRDDTIVTDGDPYLSDPTLAELFAFLLESNDARRAVARGDDLRDIIMRPVDTEEIRAEIDRLIDERDALERELDAIDERKRQLPELEQERANLDEEIEAKRDELEEIEAALEAHEADIEEKREAETAAERKLSELQSVRSTLEDVRYDLDTERQSLEELRAERRDLEAEREELPAAPVGEIDDLDAEIDRLRSRKRDLEADVDGLQSIIRFNEEMLEDVDDDVLTALADDESGPNTEEGTVTDELLADGSVQCWTCGSTVDRDRIEATVDELSDLNQQKLQDIREIETELSDLEEQRTELERQQRRREEAERELRRLDGKIAETEERVDRLTERREELTEEIETLESDIENLEDDADGEVLELHRQANQLEHELGRLESDYDRVVDQISDIEARLDDRAELEAQRETLQTEIEDLRTKIERLERDAVAEFNDHMDTVLDVLDYTGIERIWLERAERTVRQGRTKTTETVFELHVVRSTDAGATYEDTVENLSESEREVTGLVFALTGYLVHDVYEVLPFTLLDSIEAIDSDRIARLVDYLAEYSDYLLVALLPEDAAALDDDYQRIESI